MEVEKLPGSILGTTVGWEGKSQVAESPVRRLLQIGQV